MAYHRQGKYDKAEKYFHESLQTALTSGASFDIAQVMNNLGAVYYAKRDFQKAEDFLKRALTLTEAAFGPSHPELTFTLSTLGLLYSTTGRYREAEDLYRRSIGILERDKPVFDARIARILHTLSAMYGKAGRKADADAALAEAASIARRQIAQHPDMAVIFEDYAVSLKKEGKGKEAEALRGEARRARTSAGIIIHAHSPF